jgi:hypothetical protein
MARQYEPNPKGWVDRRAARAVREQLSIPDAWPAEEP